MTKLDQPQPYEGMGATIQHWSDRTATTIIQITHDGKRLILQADKATRTDQNGMSEQQDYAYERDPQGQIYIATLRKDGRYRISYTKQLVSLGYRSAYYDYSF
jgi:energy-coupling factor transporter ATP-binding protein EcfA2